MTLTPITRGGASTSYREQINGLISHTTAKARRSGNSQSSPAGTSTALLLQNELTPDTSEWSVGTYESGNKIVAAVAGSYRVTARVKLGTGSGNARIMKIASGGAATTEAVLPAVYSDAPIPLVATLQLAIGDGVAVASFCDSSSTAQAVELSIERFDAA